jgi:DNA replication and repair protein RecF
MLASARPLYGNTELESGSVFEGIFTSADLAKSYRLLRDDKREFYAIQGTKTTKPKYMNALPWRTVYISPFDMNLLYFAPAMRRDAMDLVLARVYEQFTGVKRDYELAMRQRNAMLKSIREGLSKREDLDYWDTKFAEYAEIYGLYRTKYARYIEDSLSQFPSFFSRYPLQFHYEDGIRGSDQRSGISDQEGQKTDREYIVEYLRDNRDRDILTGHTHIGPHRADWGFSIIENTEHGSRAEEPRHDGVADTISAESYLSRGEMKMILLGLKMIEREFIARTLDLPVILLIDDIFAELDERNSEIFLDSLTTHQVILTSQKPLPNHEKHHDFICINLEYS